MTDEYLKMILALSDKFFDGWEWKEGDKFLCREPYYGEESIIHPIGYEWNVHTIGDHELRDNEIYKGDYELAYKKRKEKIRPLPSQEQLLQIYKTKKDLQYDSMALLWLANWIEDKVTEDHGFCFEYESAEAIALLWVQETCFNQKWDGEKWI